MNISENLYKMSLVGAAGGLLSWSTASVVPLIIPALHTIPQERYWIVEIIDILFIGFFISLLCIGFSAYWEFGKVSIMRMVAGSFLGCIAGVLGGLLYLYQRDQPLYPNVSDHPFLAWLITGASIGTAIGFVKYGLLIRRVLLSMCGGALGGIAGGTTLHYTGEILPYFTHALGLMITGAGVAFGSTYAVVLFHKALITFKGSTDPAIEAYFRNNRSVWGLLRNDTYTWGSKHNIHGSEQYVYVPDGEMERSHAVIYEEGGKFYIAPADGNKDPNGTLRSIRVLEPESFKLIEILGPTVLKNGTEILMGRTKLQFSLRGPKWAAEASQQSLS